MGYRVLRYTNNEVFENIDRIYSDIKIVQAETAAHFKKAKIKKPNSQRSIKPAPFSAGEGLGIMENLVSNQSNQIKVLSTKKLKPNQRDLLLGRGFAVVDYDAIGIEFLDFEIPPKIENAIFTSQNGVKSFLSQKLKLPLLEEMAEVRCFCVGQNTKALLEKNGLKVIKTTDYGVDLADFILKNYKNDSFHFFCGTKRREEIPTALKSAKIELIEVKTYKTTLKPHKFEQRWDGILFFSPSGVESYFTLNATSPSKREKGLGDEDNWQIPIVFCIGKTTATAAQKYTSNIVIANATTVESVIAKAVKTLKKNNISEENQSSLLSGRKVEDEGKA